MRSNFITTLIAVLFIILGQNLLAQRQQVSDTMRFSLKDAQDYAMKNSNAAKNNKLDTKITKMRTVEILATGLPQFNAQLKYQNNYILPTTATSANNFIKLPGSTANVLAVDEKALETLPGFTLPPFSTNQIINSTFGTSNDAYLDFSASQLIADGRYFIGLQANKAFMAVAEQQSAMTEIQVRNNVANSYYAALVAEEGRRIINDNLKAVKQLNYETSELYKAGFAEELDTDRISLTLANLQSKMNDANTKADLAKTALKAAMGLDLNTPIALSDSLEGLMVSNPALTESEFDYKSRVEYKLLQLQYSIKGYDARQTVAQYMPSLYLNVLFDINAQRESFNFFDTKQPWYNDGYVAVQLNIPIFDSYKTGAVYQQKKLDQLKTANDLENFKIQAAVQVQAAKANYSNAVSDYETQKRNLALAQKIFDKVREKNKDGLATSFELSQAETSLNETQGNYVNAIYNLLVNKTELDKALGKY